MIVPCTVIFCGTPLSKFSFIAFSQFWSFLQPNGSLCPLFEWLTTIFCNSAPCYRFHISCLFLIIIYTQFPFRCIFYHCFLITLLIFHCHPTSLRFYLLAMLRTMIFLLLFSHDIRTRNLHFYCYQTIILFLIHFLILIQDFLNSLKRI